MLSETIVSPVTAYAVAAGIVRFKPFIRSGDLSSACIRESILSSNVRNPVFLFFWVFYHF